MYSDGRSQAVANRPQDNGPYFMGEGFTIIDAVLAPIFRYFDVFDDIADFGVLTDAAKLNVWRRHLCARPSVQKAVGQDYPQRLNIFLRAKDSALSKRIPTKAGEVRL
jgi:glutathione S-transferase